MKHFLLLWATCVCASAQAWIMQASGVDASLRGVSAVSAKVAWASGANGAVLRTVDGGQHWQKLDVPDAADLDFRDVQAFSERVAVIMSAGPGDKSRVYRTVDGGRHWSLVLRNRDEKGFFDSIAFADSSSGALVGDPVDGHFVVYSTNNGGATWQRVKTPPALEGEGAFAASGTSLVARGAKRWFGTGGPGCARVFFSLDAGATWKVVRTPMRNDGAAAGIFGMYFADDWRAAAVGGDYTKPGETLGNIAISNDGGRFWRPPSGAPPSGFRSAVAKSGDLWITVGTTGSDVSHDNGETWRKFDDGPFNAISFVPGGAGWAVGPKGRVARFANHP